MSQYTERILLRIFFAFVLGGFLVYLVITPSVDVLGISISVTSDVTSWILLIAGGGLVTLGIVLAAIWFFEPVTTEHLRRPEASPRPEVRKALAMLDDLKGNDRVNSIRMIKDSLPKDLSGADAILILGQLEGSDRKSGIEHLGPKISKPISDQEIMSILKGLSSYDRQRAIDALERTF